MIFAGRDFIRHLSVTKHLKDTLKLKPSDLSLAMWGVWVGVLSDMDFKAVNDAFSGYGWISNKATVMWNWTRNYEIQAVILLNLWAEDRMLDFVHRLDQTI